jgi:type IX secretion system PorP/SprF family membrane protein
MKYIYSSIVILLLVFGLNVQETGAQDPRFSQFYAAPMQLNPAMTGVFEGRWRINANYRDQWSAVLNDTPFRTAGAAFDARYRAFRSDYFGFGLDVLHDEVGDGRFQMNRAHLNFSFIKQLTGSGYGGSQSYLVAAAQAGVGQHAVAWNQFWFSEQFDNSQGLPNTGLPSGENGISGENGNTDIYPDVNAGILWYALFDNEASVYAGLAANHLNQPDVSLLDGGTENLYTRWVGHAGGEIPFGNGLSILPAIAIMSQATELSTTLGANFRYTNHDWNEVAIRAGLWPHIVRKIDGNDTKLSTDAMTVAFILELNSLNVGLSYDITTSKFNLANNYRGAFELSLIYVHPAYERIKTKCPKF